MEFKSIFNLNLELAEDCVHNLEKRQGLFNKKDPEGVWVASGR